MVKKNFKILTAITLLITFPVYSCLTAFSFWKSKDTLFVKNTNNSKAVIDDQQSTFLFAQDIYDSFRNINNNNPLKNMDFVTFLSTSFASKNVNSPFTNPLEILASIFNTNFKSLIFATSDVAVTLVGNNKIEFSYTNGPAKIIINNHEEGKEEQSFDIFVVKTVYLGLALAIDYYIKSVESSIDNSLKYIVQMLNDLCYSFASFNGQNDGLQKKYVDILANAAVGNDYLGKIIFDQFFYKMISENNLEANTILMKVWNNLFPGLFVDYYQKPMINSFIDDGTFTVLPVDVISDKTITNYNNYLASVTKLGYIFNQGVDDTDHHFAIVTLINSIPKATSPLDDSFIFNNWFLPKLGHDNSIVYSYLWTLINNYLNKPIATKTSIGTQFQVFTNQLSEIQQNKFRNSIKYDLNLTVFKYPNDTDCWKYFVANGELKETFINSIISYNHSKYNDFTDSKIAIIAFSAVLGSIIIIIIIYKLFMYLNFRKKYLEYKKNKK